MLPNPNWTDIKHDTIIVSEKIIIYVNVITIITLELRMNFTPTEGLTPNAKSFQRYGDIPVTLYTGTPNITIPLGNFTDGHLTLPFSLSYHSSGIRVEDHPGWTGLGWNLSVGGAITREVRDIPDEVSEHGYIEMCGKLGIDKLRASDIRSEEHTSELQSRI